MENVKEDAQVSGLCNCMDKDATTEAKREHSRKTRLFCFVSLRAGDRANVKKVRKCFQCSVSVSLGREG